MWIYDNIVSHSEPLSGKSHYTDAPPCLEDKYALSFPKCVSTTAFPLAERQHPHIIPRILQKGNETALRNQHYTNTKEPRL